MYGIGPPLLQLPFLFAMILDTHKETVDFLFQHVVTTVRFDVLGVVAHWYVRCLAFRKFAESHSSRHAGTLASPSLAVVSSDSVC